MSMSETRNSLISDLLSSSKRLFCERNKESFTIIRQIQRILKIHNVSKRPGNESSLAIIKQAILNELEGSGSLLGYRAMWHRLKQKYQLTVKRNTVMALLASYDPDGTAQRKTRRLKRRIYRNKGPNFLWHCDGYDKLKPYGLPIHGCIDGYSRKIIWLQVANSMSDPSYIAYYYLNAIEKIGGCPRFMRSDLGTENSTVAYLQPLMQNDLTGHIYGKSTMNQRIESLWCQLRKQFSEWWMDLFKGMVTEGVLNTSNALHIDTIRYVFGPIIQRQLDTFVCEWNSHKIRKSSMAEAPGGIPNVLYEFPQLHGTYNYRHPVDEDTIEYLKAHYSNKPTIINDTFKNLADAVVARYNLEPSINNARNGLEIYFSLITLIETI